MTENGEVLMKTCHVIQQQLSINNEDEERDPVLRNRNRIYPLSVPEISFSKDAWELLYLAGVVLTICPCKLLTAGTCFAWKPAYKTRLIRAEIT